LNFCFILKNSV